jgi:Flp pilus assembly protein CpaB
VKKVYLLAAVAALLFGGLMYLYLSGSATQGTTSTQMKEVVVAAQDIEPYQVIEETDLEIVDMPSDAVTIYTAVSKDSVVGKVCASRIVAGQMILSTQLATEGSVGSSLSYELEDGQYAMTIAFTTATGVGGYVIAGDTVEVLAWPNGDLSEDNLASAEVLVSKAEVLRVGDTSETDGASYTNLTLSLTLEECEKLYGYMAAGNGSGSVAQLYAVLDSRGDA